MTRQEELLLRIFFELEFTLEHFPEPRQLLVAVNPIRSLFGLQEILRRARSKNEELNITDLLLHAQGHFLQVLEGPEAAVRDLYATIQEDPRHSNIESLLSTSVAERTFPEWKMALDNLAVVAGEERSLYSCKRVNWRRTRPREAT